MNDRELLEKAAKAAGIEYRYEPNSHRFLIEKPTLIAGGQYLAYWNPLTDDGDALRLAVKLKLELFFFSDRVETHIAGGRVPPVQVISREAFGNDPYAATRRAIVRAAAQIGKEMKDAA